MYSISHTGHGDVLQKMAAQVVEEGSLELGPLSISGKSLFGSHKFDPTHVGIYIIN